MGKTFLMAIVSLSFLVGCKEDEFPVTYFYSPVLRFHEVDGRVEVDEEKSFCARYPLEDRQNITFGNGEKRPLSECSGAFGMSAQETPTALDWVREKLKKSNQQQGSTR